MPLLLCHLGRQQVSPMVCHLGMLLLFARLLIQPNSVHLRLHLHLRPPYLLFGAFTPSWSRRPRPAATPRQQRQHCIALR